jgi:OFA family oxalate/formate antiporter-like MFS transporter
MCAGIIAIMAIANLQNARALFSNPFTTNFNAKLAVVQVALAALMLAETWLAPIEGYLTDWLGPRAMITLRNRSRIGPKGGKRHE